ITDHDRIEGGLRVREELGSDGLGIIVGSEVSSIEGHILGLFLERDVPAGLSAERTIALIHEQGGLAIAAHPYAPIKSVGHLAATLPFDAVEIANGTPLAELANSQAKRRLTPVAKAVTGGSDAHLLSMVGSVVTLFPGGTPGDLRRAIEMGWTSAQVRWGHHLLGAPGHLLRATYCFPLSLLSATRHRVSVARERALKG
ncbi:MAG TPA: PHP-associated domain-containing protein, partial [Candidatus Dormibacteraeota bacterium]|nr:PHP-associated domain-containing protein [Candidatus Dormibacteraeota bacterium]